MNRLFPSEATLVGVEPLIQKLKLKIRRVDADILDSVRAQSTSGSQAKDDLLAAQQAIQASPGLGGSRWQGARRQPAPPASLRPCPRSRGQRTRRN